MVYSKCTGNYQIEIAQTAYILCNLPRREFLKSPVLSGDLHKWCDLNVVAHISAIPDYHQLCTSCPILR